MEWLDLYGKDKEPSLEEMDAYVNSDLWRQMNGYLQETYGTGPSASFSTCSGQPGWNVKYRKAGKALCTLYPLEGGFIALVVVGGKERDEAERMLPGMSGYTQALYARSEGMNGAKWLMMHVRDEAVLRDAQTLIALRRRPDHGRGGA